MSSAFLRDVQAFAGEVDAAFANVARLPAFLARRRFDRLKRKLIAPPYLEAAAVDAGRQPSLVSIVLPTFNRRLSLAEAVVSVQGQSLTDWELIVVDDGSSDGTADLAANYRADPRIRFVAQAHAGQAAARNHGLRLARGAIVAYIDSDNLWYPNFLKATVAVLQRAPAIDCVYAAMVSEVHPHRPFGFLFDPFDRARLLRANYIDINVFAHRRGALDISGGFDEKLNRFDDWDLILRLTRDRPAFRLPVLAAHYRSVDDCRVTMRQPAEPDVEKIQGKWRVDARQTRACAAAAGL
jgi:glycosyltransferase involved in cell wall biosynthesis